MQIRAAVVALTLALGLATPLAAEEARFDLVLRGITAGSLSWSGSGTPGGAYSVAGRLKTSGLAAMLKRLRYDAQAKGQITAQGISSPPAMSKMPIPGGGSRNRRSPMPRACRR